MQSVFIGDVEDVIVSDLLSCRVGSGLVLAVWLWRQDGTMLWFLVGAGLNAALSKVLKQVFLQTRPDGSCKGDPGMPSSHAQVGRAWTARVMLSHESLLYNTDGVVVACRRRCPQSLAFISVFLSIAVSTVASSSATKVHWLDLVVRGLAVGGLLASAVALASVRVRARLHTVAQVAVGFCFGTAAAVTWWNWGERVVAVQALDDLMDGPGRWIKAVLVAVSVAGGLAVKWNRELPRPSSKQV